MRRYIFEKKQIKLKEDEMTINSKNVNNSSNNNLETSVTPTNTATTPNLSQDLNKAITKNPTSSSYDVSLSTYLGKNSSSAPMVANINAQNSSDALQTIQQAIQTNPALKNAINNGNAIAKVHIQNGSNQTNQSATNESINFTKKELDNFLRNL